MRPEQKTVPYHPPKLRDFLSGIENNVVTVHESYVVQEKFLDQITNWIGISGLESFPYRYITNGVSSAIETLATETRPIILHKHEYPMYRLVCPNAKIVESYLPDSLAGSLAIISNPFSQNGKYNNYLYQQVVDSGANVWLDCAYIGSVPHVNIRLFPSVETVCFSFSKGFGVQYHRIGVMFTKKKHALLEKYKEFAYNNIHAARLCLKLMDRFSVTEIAEYMLPIQHHLCNLKKIEPADCVWLGLNSQGNKVSLYNDYVDYFINATSSSASDGSNSFQ